jgi:hypothetical protein
MSIPGNYLPLNELSIREAPETGGVYELANLNRDGVIRTIYIGSSEVSLRQRLLQHLLPTEPNVGIKRYAQFFKFQISSTPRELEQLLLIEYKVSSGGRLPLCNQNVT